MTDQWRLVNGKELYDINADPVDLSWGKGHRRANPKVVARLNKCWMRGGKKLSRPLVSPPLAIYPGRMRPLPTPGDTYLS